MLRLYFPRLYFTYLQSLVKACFEVELLFGLKKEFKRKLFKIEDMT